VLGNLDYEAKIAFFARLDLFALPTRYANEAEPRVVIEALFHGIPVMVPARGCLEELVTGGAGIVVPEGDDFAGTALDLIAAWIRDEEARNVARAAAAARGASLAIVFNHYSTFDLGLPLIAFFFNLMMLGWSMGLIITALILRNGLGAESLAWMAMFILSPLSWVFYPVSTLPGWLQGIAFALPSSHVFEGMRAVMFTGAVRLDVMALAFGLNLLYLAAAGLFFLHTFKVARRKGLLLRAGE
jgi:ABC-type polysaccharide/polyol phosphate export permease